jgi:hypothetical protein
MNIYISSSWENRDEVRRMAVMLRSCGYSVYDFTDADSPKNTEIPCKKYPEEFDPGIHKYSIYINKPAWKSLAMANLRTIQTADFIILLLPCDANSHICWAYGVGLGIPSAVVGQPRKGEKTPLHHLADHFFDTVDDFISWIEVKEMAQGVKI